MADLLQTYEALVEADGATLLRTTAGTWWARDKDGLTIVRGAESRAEAALLYCDDKDLTPATPDAILARVRAHYRPYDSMPEFEEGFAAHATLQYRNPYPSSVAAQAWDRGLDAAARYAIALAHLETHKEDIEKAGPGWLSRLLRTGGR
jgi:hypothetical protein